MTKTTKQVYNTDKLYKEVQQANLTLELGFYGTSPTKAQECLNNANLTVKKVTFPYKAKESAHTYKTAKLVEIQAKDVTMEQVQTIISKWGRSGSSTYVDIIKRLISNERDKNR